MAEQPAGLKSLLNRNLGAILLMSVIGFFSQALLTPVLSLYMRDVGLTDQNIGLSVSVMMVGIAIGDVTWGRIVDRVNTKSVLFFGAIIYAIATATLLIPKTLIPLLLVVVIYGFSRSPIYIVGRWYMGVHATEDVKAQAFALLIVIISLTQSLAGFSSGFFVEAWGFQNTIWIAAAVPFLAGLLVLLTGRWLQFKKPAQAQGTPDYESHRPSLVEGNARHVTIFLGSFGVLMFISQGIMMTYLPLLATDVVNLAPSQIGILFGLQGIIQTISMLPLSRLADKVGKSVFIPLAMALMVLAMGAFMISRNFAMLLMGMFILAASSGMYFPIISAILSERVPVNVVGAATGIYGLSEAIGWMIGPAVGGWLLNYWTLQSPFAFAALTASLGIPLFFWGRRKLPAEVKL
jgi:MFS family permease